MKIIMKFEASDAWAMMFTEDMLKKIADAIGQDVSQIIFQEIVGSLENKTLPAFWSEILKRFDLIPKIKEIPSFDQWSVIKSESLK